jgi:hypothetical protein
MMRTVNRRAIRDQLTARNGEHLPGGIGGSITGGPVAPLDLMEILNRTRCTSGGGAVSGAAQAVRGEEVASVALSDGSRIIFADV